MVASHLINCLCVCLLQVACFASAPSPVWFTQFLFHALAVISYGSRAHGQWDLLGVHVKIFSFSAADTGWSLQAEGNLRQNFEALQKEKETMAKVPVADNDILTLNVGGTIVVTKRATLIQVALASVHNHRAGLYKLL